MFVFLSIYRYDLFCDLADNIVSTSEAIRQVLGIPDRATEEAREEPSMYSFLYYCINLQL